MRRNNRIISYDTPTEPQPIRMSPLVSNDWTIPPDIDLIIEAMTAQWAEEVKGWNDVWKA